MITFQDFLTELNKSTIKSYKDKTEEAIDSLKPHTKGEYGDIAKNIIARKRTGLKMANKKLK
jgi:hypothetical protein